ncbi:MAG: hypothetical protein ABH871_09025 [Pseudomonadota bacterium]
MKEKMLPAEVIEKLRKEKELDDRPCLRLPLFPPERVQRDGDGDTEEEEQTFNGVIEIDLV